MNLRTIINYGIHKVRQHGITHVMKRLLFSLRETSDPFDLQNGTDTGGNIPLYKLSICGSNAAYGVQYKASPSEVVAKAIKDLPIIHKDFTFIDIGSGKGRTLIIAKYFGFKKVIGVEFAQELAEISRKNCPDAEIYCCDATLYDFPMGNLVIYMYNPFEHPVMEKVMTRIATAAKSRTIYLIYLQPNCKDIVLKYATAISQHGWIMIFKVSKIQMPH